MAPFSLLYMNMKPCITCGDPTSNPKFCSRSCSATFNNKGISRQRKTKFCKTCSSLINSSHTYCKDCFTTNTVPGKSKDLIGSRTIEQSLSGNRYANAYRTIRSHARRILEQNQSPVCCKCNYSIYVECCHIIPISSFPKDTTINIVNAPNNLVWLCPNCHWEFDHGLLSI